MLMRSAVWSYQAAKDFDAEASLSSY